MNITVKNAELVRELALLDKIIARKPSIPVLANVLIRAQNGHTLELSCTDLELGLTSSCLAEVSLPGAITLPAHRLIELIRAQSATTCSLTADASGNVAFKSGGFQSRLQTNAAEDFPRLASAADLPTITLPRVAMKDLLNQVRFAASEKEAGNYTIRGVLMVLTPTALTFVATDGSRLAVASVAHANAETKSVILPNKLVAELVALLEEEGDAPVQFSHSDQHLFFTIDRHKLLSRQVEGNFPAYERIIPRENDKTVLIPRADFIAVIKRHVLIDDVVLLTLNTNALDVASVSLDVGEGRERIAVTYEGQPVQIRFRGQFVLDFLTAATSQMVKLSLKDELSPALFTDGSYLNVIMGMRV